MKWLRLQTGKTKTFDQPIPFNAVMNNNNFPNQYYCNNNQRNPDVHLVLHVLQGLHHSTSITQVTHRSCIHFLSDCLFIAFCPFLKFSVEDWTTSPMEQCRLLPAWVGAGQCSLQGLFTSSFVSAWDLSHRLLLKLEMYFSNSPLFYGFSVACPRQLHRNIC